MGLPVSQCACVLIDNNIGIEGVKGLAEALKVNTALQTLDLSGMPPNPPPSQWDGGGGAAGQREGWQWAVQW